MNDKAELILHPIRMRIIQTLIGDRNLTAQQIGQILDDVPQATLYRHLNKLAQASLISIVEQRPVRGTVEKVYGLKDTAANVSHSDLQAMSRSDHLRYFMQFVASVISDFGHYLEKDSIDFVKDGVGYRKLPLYVSEEEMPQFSADLGQALLPYLQDVPGKNRKRRILTTIILPEPELTPDSTKKQADTDR